MSVVENNFAWWKSLFIITKHNPNLGLWWWLRCSLAVPTFLPLSPSQRQILPELPAFLLCCPIYHCLTLLHWVDPETPECRNCLVPVPQAPGSVTLWGDGVWVTQTHHQLETIITLHWASTYTFQNTPIHPFPQPSYCTHCVDKRTEIDSSMKAQCPIQIPLPLI